MTVVLIIIAVGASIALVAKLSAAVSRPTAFFDQPPAPPSHSFTPPPASASLPYHRPNSERDWWALPRVKAAMDKKPPDVGAAKALLAPLAPYVSEFSGPRQALLFRYQGEISAEEQRPEEAVKFFNQALALDPGVGIKKRRDKLAESIGASVPKLPPKPSSPPEPCPYCQAMQSPPPKRKKRCKDCGGLVYVKSRPADRTKRLVTEAEHVQIEREWSEYNAGQSHARLLAQFGIAEAYAQDVQTELRQQFGAEPSSDDVLWGAANKKVSEAIARQDWGSLQSLYFSMALFMHDRGKPFFELLQESARATLRGFRHDGGRRARLTPSDGCEHCSATSQREYSIAAALKEMPIPRLDCTWDEVDGTTDGWCRCYWEQVWSD